MSGALSRLAALSALAVAAACAALTRTTEKSAALDRIDTVTPGRSALLPPHTRQGSGSPPGSASTSTRRR
ncbi:MAG TPA: hypothetical protein VNE21_05550 [Mycobacteriales bacterium]|nr:hypothetical protein [Mycobacteriales bacterium]